MFAAARWSPAAAALLGAGAGIARRRWRRRARPGGLALALLALWFMAGNLALQYGAARLPANATAVVMVSEVLFASVSAVAARRRHA